MISGVLLLAPEKSEPVAVFYRKRFSRILIPLASWTIVYSIIRIWPFLHDPAALGPESLRIFKDILAGNPYYHLWYMYMLVGLYLFLPILRFCVKSASFDDLRLLCMAWFAIAIISSAAYTFNGPLQARFSIFIGSFSNFIPYCLAGYVIAASKAAMRAWRLWVIVVAGGVLSVIMTHALGALPSEPRFYAYSFVSITIVPMSLALFKLAKRLTLPLAGNRFNARFADFTLGIYLIHPAVLKALAAFGFNATSFHPAFSIPFLAVSTFMLSAACTAAIATIPLLKKTVT